MAKRKKQQINENKVELAKAIAEKSRTIKKTYDNVENTFVKAFRTISSWIDFILFNQKFSKLVALCLAIILYLVINGAAKSSIFMNNIQQAVTLDNVKVSFNISESVYEVTGLPESVTVTVKGDTSDVQFASQQKEAYQVLADLTDLSEGSHQITLTPLNFSNKVDVAIEPSTAVVMIKKKISRSFNVGYDYINTDKLDKIYSLAEPDFSQKEVIVRASEDTMSQISFVKALIDLDGIKADFEQDATLVAYDQNGEKIKVDILPEKTTVKVKVTTPHKEVPIMVVPEGDMKEGLAVDSYTLDHSSITVYAPQKVLDELDKIEIKVPVNKINENTSLTMPVMLPNSVSKGSISKVKISLKVKESVTKEIENVSILYKNYNDNFKIVLGEVKPSTTVIIKGSKDTVEAIKAEDISVVMDLAQFSKPGTYEIPLKVSGTNKLATYKLKYTTIKITLEGK